MSTTIRCYQSADAQAVSDLWNEVFPAPAPHNLPEKILADKLPLADDLIFVAELNGQIVGTTIAGWDGHRGWLYAVAVSADQRRSGIGAELVRAAEGALAALGCSKVNLQIRAGNEAVANFYASLGYEVEPRTSMGRLLDSPE